MRRQGWCQGAAIALVMLIEDATPEKRSRVQLGMEFSGLVRNLNHRVAASGSKPLYCTTACATARRSIVKGSCFLTLRNLREREKVIHGEALVSSSPRRTRRSYGFYALTFHKRIAYQEISAIYL